MKSKNWILQNLKRHRDVENFIRYNKRLLNAKSKLSVRSRPVALFETNHAFTTHILYSIICRIKHKNKIKLVAYRPLRYKKIQDIFSFELFSRLSVDNAINRPYRILKSFGIDQFLQPSGLKTYKSKATKDYLRVINKEKKEILELEIDQILIGDIFYDWHLRESMQDTIDVTQDNFKTDFIFFMCNFYWWYDYFDRVKVNSIFTSHSCSDLALPARIGLRFGANAYVAAWGKMHKIDSTRMFSDLEFIEYIPNSREQFGYEINLQNSRHLLNKAKTGEIVIDAHVLGSGYKGKHYNEVVEDKNDFNILIAAHCFSDPPHSYGDMQKVILLFGSLISYILKNSWVNFPI